MKTIVSLIASSAVAASAGAATFTNSPDADSFVRAAAPTANYGGAGALSVSGATATNLNGAAQGVSDTFMRFNTSAMAASFNSTFGAGNWAVSGATLAVTETGAPANAVFNRGAGHFEIKWIVNDNWTEGSGMPMSPGSTGIVYNNEATLLNPAVDCGLGVFTNAGVDGVLSFPLALTRSFVGDLDLGGEVGLYLTATDPQTGFTFNSRSFTTASARPTLQISALPVPVLTGIQVAGAGATLTVTNITTNAVYILLTSTNLATPLAQWIVVATNSAAANGPLKITMTNTQTQGAPQRYFVLSTRAASSQ